MEQSELEKKKTEALTAFQKQYPASNSGDLQTFILGMNAMETILTFSEEDEAKGKTLVISCNCGNEGEAEHCCPYKEDIHGDSETLCNCCSECQHQCAMDI